MKTGIGNFGIGFRRSGSEWQRDLSRLAKWSVEQGFECLDLGSNADDIITVLAAGLRLGSADLSDWQEMASADAGKRGAALERQTEFILQVTKAAGPTNFFVVMLPEDPQRSRRENFDLMVQGFRPLMPVLEASGSKLVIEGYPGPGALCCTPETLRPFFEAMKSDAAGINFDPSHLLRMRIDPVRFLREFCGRVFHVHAKDTRQFEEDYYEFGTEQPGCFTSPHRWGGTTWRYTIPGAGSADWKSLFEILEREGYAGFVSVELEDENFNGTTEGEQRGLLESARFLSQLA